MQKSKKIPFDLVERNFIDILRLLYLEYYYLTIRLYTIFKTKTSISNIIEAFFELVISFISIPINMLEKGKYLIKLSDKSIPNYGYSYNGNELNLFLFTILKTTCGKGLISDKGTKILNPIYDKITLFYCDNLLVIETTLKDVKQVYLCYELNLSPSDINNNTQIDPFIKEYFNWKDYIEVHGIEKYKTNIIDKYKNINLWKYDYDTTYIGSGLLFDLKINVKKINFYKDSIYNCNQINDDSFFLLKHENFDNKRNNSTSQEVSWKYKENVLCYYLFTNCVFIYNNKIMSFDNCTIYKGYITKEIIYLHNNRYGDKNKIITHNGLFDSDFIFSYPSGFYYKYFLIYNKIEDNTITLTVLNSKFKSIDISDLTNITIFSFDYKKDNLYKKTEYFILIHNIKHYTLYDNEFNNLYCNIKDLREVKLKLGDIKSSKLEYIITIKEGIIKNHEVKWSEFKI